MSYCIYLRKSRMDAEAEAHGEGETLARHEKALLELAARLRLDVTEIYREIVSGETIAARPAMQKLLSDVESGKWDGVLVMEVERLARGDTIDQGIVSQTFKYSGTKIVTPSKTYDPENEFDEEYFEFGLFMSRREYKTINRRLQRGRVTSVKEGKYVSNRPPYGYTRVPLTEERGFTLAPVEDEANIVRLIYEYYTAGEQKADGTVEKLGVSKIARRLNEMGIPSKTDGLWTCASIRDMLINPVYIGMVRWNWRKQVRRMENGTLRNARPRSKDVLLCRGRHPAIISEETFRAAKERIEKNPPAPVPSRYVVKNPLSGLLVCGSCGHRLVRRPETSRNYPEMLMCPSPECHTVGAKLAVVERKVLRALREWLEEYKLRWGQSGGSDAGKGQITQLEVKKKALKKANEELETLINQMRKVYDLLERGIYDTNTFLDRSKELSERITQCRKGVDALCAEVNEEAARENAASSIIPKVERLLEVYDALPSPKAKNDMLKEILEKIVYMKDHRSKKNSVGDDFDIFLYPRVPTELLG